MKVVDQVVWDTLRNKARVDDPGYHEGKNVILFVEDWCTAIEEYIDEHEHEYAGTAMWVDHIHKFCPKPNGVNYVSFLSTEEFGEALVILCSNWTYGELFANGLTLIESKLYVEAVQRMVTSQQLAAQDTEKPQKHLA